jgi:hypothetical protein
VFPLRVAGFAHYLDKKKGLIVSDQAVEVLGEDA